MNTQEIFDKIEDYSSTVHAIVAFINFYRFDDEAKCFRNDVIVFQGRRFDPSPAKKLNENGNEIAHVCPDLGVLLPGRNGVLGEVKKSFPKETEHWMDDFKQLMSYDDNLTGWPHEEDGQIESHDIVLIVEQSRGVAVQEFYEQKRDGGEIHFDRSFSIVEFNRSDEGKQYYFFRKRPNTGPLSDSVLDKKLRHGSKVPMEVLVAEYSTILLYDDDPPLAYLMQLIWEHVVLPQASDEPRFIRLHRNQTMEIILNIDEITESLRSGFSFRQLHGDGASRQPESPRSSCVLRACQELVNFGEAEWVEEQVTIKVLFRKYEDIGAHFVEACAASDESAKLPLFDD